MGFQQILPLLSQNSENPWPEGENVLLNYIKQQEVIKY